MSNQFKTIILCFTTFLFSVAFLQNAFADKKQDELWDKAKKEYFREGKWAECIKAIEELPPDEKPEKWSYLAFCYWKVGDYERAKKSAKKDLDLQPTSNRSKFVLGSIYAKEGETKIAEKLFREIQAVDPEYPGIEETIAKLTNTQPVSVGSSKNVIPTKLNPIGLIVNGLGAFLALLVSLRKGYNCILWTLGGNIISLIVLIFLPTIKDENGKIVEGPWPTIGNVLGSIFVIINILVMLGY